MIKFGTDGWRGVIARDFTFENLHLVAYATARYLLKYGSENPSVVIGYDTRFLSKEFAEETAQILAWKGVTVNLTNSFVSTPQVSFHSKHKRVDLGIVITASHNPAVYNGFKLKANFGGPATPEQIKKLESELKKIIRRPPQFKFKELEDYVKIDKIRYFNGVDSYIRAIKRKLDIEAIKKSGFKVIYDPMYGAGIGMFKRLLPESEELHGEYNPSFGDLDHPEPIADYLPDLIYTIKSGDYDIGLAADGDADRLGVVDEEGKFVDAHKVFMILLKYLYEERKKRGSVVKTVSLTSMVDKFCEKNGLELHETPVGFKHSAKIMSEEQVLIGGEESGGLATALHIPERDGIFNGMLLLEVMAKRGKTIRELCVELEEEFGNHRFMRRDVKVTPKYKQAVMDACKKSPKKLGKHEVERIDDTDGYKFFVKDGWLLIRPSGTEPLLRFYAEARSLRMVNNLLEQGLKLK